MRRRKAAAVMVEMAGDLVPARLQGLGSHATLKWQTGKDVVEHWETMPW